MSEIALAVERLRIVGRLDRAGMRDESLGLREGTLCRDAPPVMR
jgi:hypothetical protein